MSPLIDAALSLAARGFRVFPCLDKRPMVKGWPEVASADEVEVLFAGHPGATHVGVSTAGLMVVDVDLHKPGTVVPPEIAGAATFTVSTPRGGLHYYFHPSAPVTNSVSCVAPGVDIRGDGGFVVAAGPGYSVVFDAPVAPADPTLEAKVRRPPAPAAAPPVSAPAPAGTDLLVAQYLRTTAAPAVEGEGGNDTAYRTALAVRDHGLDEQDAVALMLGHYNPRCVPPWSEAELTMIVAHAYKYGKLPAGDKLPSAATDLAMASVASDWNGVPVATLLAVRPEPVRELIPGWLERGVPTLFSGPGGSNKSRFALQTGLDLHTKGACEFVYVSTEDHRDEVARRTHAIARRLVPTDPARGFGTYIDRVGKPSTLVQAFEDGTVQPTPAADELKSALLASDAHKLVVLDSAYNFLTFAGKSKIDEGAVNSVWRWLTAFGIETDSTILLLWHPSASGASRSDAPGWSVAWHNAPRSRWSINPAKDQEGVWDLRLDKRNHGRSGLTRSLQWDDGVLIDQEQDTEAFIACVTYWSNFNPMTMTKTQAVQLRDLGYTPRQVVAAISQLVSEGILVQGNNSLVRGF